MANIEITNNATNGVVIWDPKYNDETLTAPGAETWLAGTLLGRITASGKMTRYTSGAGDGSEIPLAVLQDELIFTGAGDVPGRPIVAAGGLRREKLVAFGVGAITIGEADQLRDFGLVSFTTKQLAELDNQ